MQDVRRDYDYDSDGEKVFLSTGELTDRLFMIMSMLPVMDDLIIRLKSSRRLVYVLIIKCGYVVNSV
jgi:hypothetical protein